MDRNSDEHTSTVRDGFEIEYSALRSEILKRIELQQQFMSVTEIAGVFLGIGVITTAAIALVYPPLTAFLAISWAQHDSRIRN